MQLKSSVVPGKRGLLLIFVGGIIGTAVRLHLGQAFPVSSGKWPITTYLVNVSGALILASLLTFLTSTSRLSEETSNQLRLFAGVGICGGFTTYSTFADEQIHLIRDGHILVFLGYGAATLVSGAIATLTGVILGKQLLRLRLLM